MRRIGGECGLTCAEPLDGTRCCFHRLEGTEGLACHVADGGYAEAGAVGEVRGLVDVDVAVDEAGEEGAACAVDGGAFTGGGGDEAAIDGDGLGAGEGGAVEDEHVFDDGWHGAWGVREGEICIGAWWRAESLEW